MLEKLIAVQSAAVCNRVAAKGLKLLITCLAPPWQQQPLASIENGQPQQPLLSILGEKAVEGGQMQFLYLGNEPEELEEESDPGVNW